MDEQKKKSQKKRSVIPIYAIGAVWLLYAGKLNTFRGIVSCAVVSAIVYGILRIVLRGKKTDTPEEAPVCAFARGGGETFADSTMTLSTDPEQGAGLFSNRPAFFYAAAPPHLRRDP